MIGLDINEICKDKFGILEYVQCQQIALSEVCMVLLFSTSSADETKLVRCMLI